MSKESASFWILFIHNREGALCHHGAVVGGGAGAGEVGGEHGEVGGCKYVVDAGEPFGDEHPGALDTAAVGVVGAGVGVAESEAGLRPGVLQGGSDDLVGLVEGGGVGIAGQNDGAIDGGGVCDQRFGLQAVVMVDGAQDAGRVDAGRVHVEVDEVDILAAPLHDEGLRFTVPV